MATTKNSVDMSLPKARKVRGYTIERMPIGRFLQATQTLQEAPEQIVKQLFPDAEGTDVLKMLANLTSDGLRTILLRAMSVIPGYAVRLFAELSGLDEDQLITDPAIGLDGLVELVDAWIAVNGIENFIKAAGALVEKVRKTKAAGSAGYNA